ncbi:MAG: DNA methyltransferase [Candidatus Harrisonbacteria bacterium CG10_big_fil_rev_8_21_14_0_10_42_17]|uniref:site-specific DNA-methyltransferase (adenine-specific) n=1 Tax=Candidatus Harrisonbacteria bacterium CG10_big_fil_rev_8_21_14_0_10_42_17 TaxID=1974584 RepID=A0A2M6WH86_9BACT|nr:MAG: DNA methyltransferase [Candidatus Harrisonbacteria bacterium CG10_big_fil_rev_8_21_14_0_10_42_17]
METEGIKYTGSKREIIPTLLELVRPLNVRTVFDGFTGTTRVAQAFKKAGYTVYANDVAVWSKIFGDCYLVNQKPAIYYQPILDRLNKIPGKRGWFSEHYGGEPNGGSAVNGDGKKKMWQFHNTMKLDAIREEIDNIAKDEVEKSVLLTSLIIAMDKVDSSVGHHVSYLKRWAPRAYNTMRMVVPKLIIDDKKHKIFNNEIFDLLDDVKVDLAYFDPPYGSSNELMPPSRVRYASYYHLWKTVCLNDKPKVVGVADRREDVGDVVAGSIFEDFRKNEDGRYIVIDALKKLIDKTNAKYIVLSYNNNGRATFDAITGILRELKMKCSILEMDYRKNVMATMAWTNEWLSSGHEDIKNKEFLFLIQKDKSAKPVADFKIEKINLRESVPVGQKKLALF